MNPRKEKRRQRKRVRRIPFASLAFFIFTFIRFFFNLSAFFLPWHILFFCYCVSSFCMLPTNDLGWKVTKEIKDLLNVFDPRPSVFFFETNFLFKEKAWQVLFCLSIDLFKKSKGNITRYQYEYFILINLITNKWWQRSKKRKVLFRFNQNHDIYLFGG